MSGADRAKPAIAKPAGQSGQSGQSGQPGQMESAGGSAGRESPAASVLVAVALASILVLTAGVRVRLLDVPLERDEGEYAYAAQLLVRGVAPYEHVYSMKPPGIYVAYAAVLAAFGETQRGVHLGLLCANAATIVLLFLLGRRLIGDVGGIAASAAFAALSSGAAVQGMFANAEHFVVLPVVAGLWLLVRSTPGRGSAFAAGLLFGIAILIKQHGAFLAIAGGVVLTLRVRRREWATVIPVWTVFAFGVVLPYVAMCAALWFAGVFETFWLWTFQYAFAYTEQISLAELPTRLISKSLRVMRHAWMLWALAGLGAVALLRPRLENSRAVLGAIALCSVLAVLPGLYLRPHYFVLMLPAAALLFAVLVSEAGRAAKTAVAKLVVVGLLIGVPVAQTAWAQRAILFEMPPDQVTRAVYPGNPFVESVVVADYIAARTGPDDTLAVIGSEPQIYFYAQRRGATGFIYTYPLGEEHPYADTMQDQMIAEIRANQPKFIVWVHSPSSWGPRHADAATRLLEWLPGYLDGYELAMVAEPGPGGARYLEGAALQGRGERLRDSLEVYRRQETEP